MVCCDQWCVLYCFLLSPGWWRQFCCVCFEDVVGLCCEMRCGVVCCGVLCFSGVLSVVSCVAINLATIMLCFLRCWGPMLWIAVWLGLMWCVVFNGVLGFGFGSGKWCSCFVCCRDGVNLCGGLRLVVACCGVLCSIVFFVLLLCVARKLATIVWFFNTYGEHVLLDAGRCGWLWCVVFNVFCFVARHVATLLLCFRKRWCAYVLR